MVVFTQQNQVQIGNDVYDSWMWLELESSEFCGGGSLDGFHESRWWMVDVFMVKNGLQFLLSKSKDSAVTFGAKGIWT